MSACRIHHLIKMPARFDDPNDLRKDFPRFTPEALEANFKVVDFLKDLVDWDIWP